MFVQSMQKIDHLLFVSVLEVENVLLQHSNLISPHKIGTASPRHSCAIYLLLFRHRSVPYPIEAGQLQIFHRDLVEI